MLIVILWTLIITLEKKISQNTKCIVVTHLFGYPCKIDEIKKITKKNNIFLTKIVHNLLIHFKNTETGMFGDVVFLVVVD